MYQSEDQTTKVHYLIPDHQYSGLVQHFTPYYCSPITLTDVTQQDQRTYNFMATPCSFQVVHLSVTELQVDMVPDSVLEGYAVTLTCKTTCRLTDTPTFTWYKSGSELYSIYNSNLLHLPAVSQEDSGSYSCAVKGQSYRSPAVTLNVYYPPKRVSVSISPSGEIVEGSSVTLTCSSDANPPVHDYTWYKETSFIRTGQSYIINRIRSEDSGEYKCNVRNQYGEKYSDGATLNVLYPPKRVSVSISPSGEIVEGSSVTLTCSSDANPPVHDYTWYKGTSSIGTEQSYIIHRISSKDSGEYKCKSSNQYGEKYSEEVTVKVLYPPKRVSVSISPSGEIVEGSSVTLTCSSDANPPVHDYTWYKETSFIRTGQSYIINRIRSEDSGEYKCNVRNQYGEKYSDGATLNVLYPPKRVSVSISPSGEIVEGSSVTLTCSSDANPPVHDYTWYKGTSSIGTEQSYIIHRIRSEDSGEYKCKARNRYGEKYSDGVTLNFLYPPKSVLVSISPSGEIVEGSSVTLTCSSDAKPPVVSYNWYKGTSFIRTGQSYIINRFRSEDSGEYKCKARNRYGEKYSDGVTLNFLYPPKRVSVSISRSGEIVEGSSVTLTCSSDAKPPVHDYTWYKGTSSIGTEQSYIIHRIRSEDSGDYKCKARNRYGEKYSDKATVKVLCK
ncbi:B-cell receptor CD22-like [Pangasianodon hypophthalmus]|uniref:B-cell receptor CD22-like n=1 Tax=Pangasianodon hypophthalmus TaxID=310915 RepID=UPI0023081F0F|nr:B-cell receptor CD22-like [Pangasianodon hypophthalmus]